MTTRLLIIYNVIDGDTDFYVIDVNESELKKFESIHNVYGGCAIDDEVKRETIDYICNARYSGEWDKYKVDSSKLIDVNQIGGIDKIILTGFAL